MPVAVAINFAAGFKSCVVPGTELHLIEKESIVLMFHSNVIDFCRREIISNELESAAAEVESVALVAE